MDVDATRLFGDCTPDLSHHSSRILDSHIPFYVRKYRRELHRQFSAHNIYDRVLRLSQLQGPPTSDDIDKYEAVDCNTTKACLSAERKLGNPKVVPWSPELLIRLGTQYYWKKLQSLKSTKKKIPSRLRDVADSLGQPTDSDFKLSVAQLKKRGDMPSFALKNIAQMRPRFVMLGSENRLRRRRLQEKATWKES